MGVETSSPRIIQSDAVKNWNSTPKTYSFQNRGTQVISFVSPETEYQILMSPEMTVAEAVKQFLKIIDYSEFPPFDYKEVELVLKFGVNATDYNVGAWYIPNDFMRFKVYGLGPKYDSLRGVRFEINKKNV
ncbi:hypothetical protein [Parashewanella tropica]|uniref:hypothetical protein n=1 Tax=Parashewanella tropica TaxID=2547970 RepID=UPI00105A4259|nr:hypothetical protein [Parashewanella tropica]